MFYVTQNKARIKYNTLTARYKLIIQFNGIGNDQSY